MAENIIMDSINKKISKNLKKVNQAKINNKKGLPSTWIPDDEGFDLSFDYAIDENPKEIGKWLSKIANLVNSLKEKGEL